MIVPYILEKSLEAWPMVGQSLVWSTRVLRSSGKCAGAVVESLKIQWTRVCEKTDTAHFYEITSKGFVITCTGLVWECGQ